MEQEQVCIVGAGPSGLALGLALAQQGIKSIILEKNIGITEDPRGVVLYGDSVRILHALGIGDRMDDIGHVMTAAMFHKTSFKNEPFFIVPCDRDLLSQSVPYTILQSQPKLEQALRDAVNGCDLCELRDGCEVFDRDDSDTSVTVKYTDADGKEHSIRCSWLIGADGKRGVVRKRFLEASGGIKQVTGKMKYQGTWVIANLKLGIPTPDTHPDFPLWQFGLTPQQVYELFWPKNWHFCSPPGLPVACGNFGPHQDRLWRHEIAVSQWDDSMDAQKVLMDNLLPMITRENDGAGHAFPSSVTYPTDCIEVLRCAPAFFSQKIVNRWFHKRTILIGDAAHVFPPFAGQGIACGIRDAHSLAWRLALLERMQSQSKSQSQALADRLLTVWSREMLREINAAVQATLMMGNVLHATEPWFLYNLRRLTYSISFLPMLRYAPHIIPRLEERLAYLPPDEGLHLSRFNGRFKTAQIHMRTSSTDKILSDGLLTSRDSVMTLLVIGKRLLDREASVRNTLQEAKLDPAILSDKSILYVDLDVRKPIASSVANGAATKSKEFSPTRQVSRHATPLSEPEARLFQSRMGLSTAFAIVRPDFTVFGTAKTLQELAYCLDVLKTRLQ